MRAAAQNVACCAVIRSETKHLTHPDSASQFASGSSFTGAGRARLARNLGDGLAGTQVAAHEAMKNLAGSGVFLLILLTACSPAPERSETPPAVESLAGPSHAAFVFTTDEGASGISRIDVATGEIESFALPIRPHNVQASEDGSHIIVAGPVVTDEGAHRDHGAEGGTAGRLLVIDVQSVDIANAVSVDVGSHPAHVVADSGMTRVYLTDSGSNVVQIVDLSQRRVVSEVPTGRYPHGLRLSSDGSTLAVANLQDDSVSLIDAASARETARIQVGRAPVQVAWAPDGETVYVSLRDEDAVAAVDRRSRRKSGSVPVGDGPIQLFVTPDGRHVYVANEGTAENPATTVSVIDTSTMQVVRTIPAGRGPHGVAITRDGTRVYVSNRFDDSVSEIDASSQTVVRTHRVGAEPTGITYAAPLRPLP
jgi:YVTN family beta-propeller protein